MLQEVELTQKPTPKQSRKRYLFKAAKIALPILAVLIVAAAGIGIWGFFGYRLAKADIQEVSREIDSLKSAVEKQNISEVKKQNGQLKLSLQKTKKNLSKYHLATYIPILAGYYNDANHLLQAGLVGTEAAEIGVEAIEPFADVLGLEGHDSKVNAEAKAEIVVREVIPKLAPKVDQLAAKIKQIKLEIDQVDPYHYPAGLKIKGIKVQGALLTAQKEIKKVEALLPEIKPVLAVLPAIAGTPTEKNYLVLFQNDKELRPTGGFITSYARAKVYGGRLVNVTSGDIQDLDQAIPRKDPVLPYLNKYLAVKEWTIHDANVYPDYKLSAQKVEDFYYRIPKIPKIDGVIAVDTEFVRRLLTITGPIKSKKLKETFSAEKNELGIPDVVYKLELYVEKILAADPNHKSIMGDLMNDIIDKVSALQPEKFEPLLTTIFEAAAEKHLLFYFNEPSAQALAEKFNFAGLLKDYSGDYLHVNNANFGGLKGNLFTKFDLDQEINIAADGTVTKTVTTTIANTAKADGWLNATYSNWQRLYVPAGSTLIDQKTYRDFSSGEESGKQFFASYSRTSPLTKSSATYTYKLPFKIKKGEKYRLLVQKQPGTDVTSCTIKINGKLVKSFELRADQELEFEWN